MAPKGKKRRVPPDKLRAAAMGGWYKSVKTPETFTCTGCHEERNSIGQEGGLCLRCRWERNGPAVRPGRETGN